MSATRSSAVGAMVGAFFGKNRFQPASFFVHSNPVAMDAFASIMRECGFEETKFATYDANKLAEALRVGSLIKEAWATELRARSAIAFVPSDYSSPF
jgi:hypothetical protein